MSRSGTVVPPGKGKQRKGVAAVLAMMFLILFGSLSAAMAISSKGNITTAATHQHVSRAQSAAETGLAIAQQRLADSASRFLVSKSNVDSTFGWDLWRGSTGSLGTVTVVPSRIGRQDLGTPSGIIGALSELHALDQAVVAGEGVDVPTIRNAESWASTTEYKASNWLQTPVVGLENVSVGDTTGRPPLAYTITYAPLENGTDIRVIVTGFDYGYNRNGEPISRVMTRDFRISKRIRHAMIAPTRVMIGKNVSIQGDMGMRFTSVASPNGDPLVLKSDFAGLDTALDNKLRDFRTALGTYDTDGDNRLRVNHPTERAGIPSDAADYDGDGRGDHAFDDVTADGYVDEFDIFIRHYDRNGDGRLILPNALTAGTAYAGQTAEFTADVDLAWLIDSAYPDRNKNGVFGYTDTNNNGRWEAGETMLDWDPVHRNNRDQVLGFRDGVIDYKDQYAKVQGKLAFRTTQAAWTTAQGSLQTKLQGPIAAPSGEVPRAFGVPDSVLPDVSSSVFSQARNSLQAAANGSTFAQQVASPVPVPGQTVQITPLSADANNDGLPDNWNTTAYFEKMPYNSPNYSDYYYRPVYRNMVFRDVEIPMGTNALFINCWFVGVTWVRCDVSNTHVLWGEYGKMTIPSGQTRPQPHVARIVYGDDAGETSYPSMLPATARPPSQMIRMALATPMDKADIPANQVASTTGYANLPDPLIIAGQRVVDTKQFSNNLRFHDCLIVGSLVSDAPSNFTQARNKLQFTGSTRFVQTNPERPNDASMNPESGDRVEIAKSSLMVPNYSVDVGSFNSPSSQNVQLRGAVIAGVMDVRGNCDIDGALLLTYAPVAGQGPLRDALNNPIGNPAGFNTTLGYFGPNDGDSEALDPSTLPLVGGVRIAGWDTNGDGLADVNGNQPQPGGSTAIPFNGYGRISLRFNPTMNLPDGIMLPMACEPIAGTYREGRP